MLANVGRPDRIVRIVLGLALLSLLVVTEPPVRWFGLIGLVPLLTGSFGFCPLYRLLGLSTCPVERV